MADEITPKLEETIRRSYAVPPIRPEFVDGVYFDLVRRGIQKKRPARLCPAWVAAIGVAVLLVALVLLAGPSRVSAAFSRLFGFIPGVGIVDQASPMRVLAAPVAQTRDGVTVTVKAAFLTGGKTLIAYSEDGIPFSAQSHDEAVPGCLETGVLRLPDGSMLKVYQSMGADYVYPPVPTGVTEATFVLTCLNGTLPGKAPENWELPLRFVPAPPDLTAFPIINLPTATLSAAPVDGTQTSMAATTQTAPASRFGLKNVIDQVISTDDGYNLIGHTDWTDNRITTAMPMIKVYDATGQAIPAQAVNFRDIGMDATKPGQWGYQVKGKTFNGPLTLRAIEFGLEYTPPVTFSFDPRAYGFDGSDAQLGKTWTVDSLPLDVLGLRASLVRFKVMKLGDEKGFEFGLDTDPTIRSLSFGLKSAVTGGRGGSGGGSNRDEASGFILTYVLVDGQMAYPMSLETGGVTLTGVWETQWDPPAGDAGVTPSPIPRPCLTLDGWKAAVKQPDPLPAGMSGKILFERSRPVGLPALFTASVDGSGEQALPEDASGSISPDGTRLVSFVAGTGSVSSALRVVDLKTGKFINIVEGEGLSGGLWSPEGNSVAYLQSGGSQQIKVVNLDGSSPKVVVSLNENLILDGWTPDSTRIVYSMHHDNGIGSTVYTVNVATGEQTTLFDVQMDGPSPAFSPEGQWIAYRDLIFGENGIGLYLVHPDGSGKHLLISLDYWGVGKPVWSLDGKWIAFGMVNTDLFVPTEGEGLINVETCQAISLTNLGGTIQAWVK